MADDMTRRFCTLLHRMEAVTGSPGLTSFHEGHVHMNLREYERIIDALEKTSTGSGHKEN